MSDNIEINGSAIILKIGDITDLEVEAFVYYARSDLQLGSGFGGAITVRGGASIQEELKQFGKKEVCEAVITSAGKLKANYIIHAIGPKFQEEQTEEKLEKTMMSVFKLADEKGIKQLAFPPMGAGFYGVPLAVSAKICLASAKKYLEGASGLKEIIFCMVDNREYLPFRAEMDNLINEEVRA